MNAVFYNRNYAGTVPLGGLEISVERYSRDVIGGPDTATIKVKPSAKKWDLLKLLRCPVEIYGKDGKIKWWGYVNKVMLPQGKIRIGKGLDEMYNYITVEFDEDTTAAAADNESITEYGRKEFFISSTTSTETEAESDRDIYLARHKYPVQEMDLSGGNDEIVIECYGWWKTLSWMYYTNAATTPVENTTQISDIITACGQFINGVIIENTSGLTSVPTRDGSNNARSYIEELLNAGSSNSRPMLAYVDKDRYVHVYERAAESTERIMRNDGNLETLQGRFVQPEDCLASVWFQAKGLPDTASLYPFFIEWAEYVADGDIGHVQYRSADAFTQHRLDQYVANIASGSANTLPSGIGNPPSGGGGTTTPPSSGVLSATLGLDPEASNDMLDSDGSGEVLTIDTIFQDTIGVSLSGSSVISGFPSGWYSVQIDIEIENTGAKIPSWFHKARLDGAYGMELNNIFEILQLGFAEGITEAPHFSISGGTYIDGGDGLRVRLYSTITGGGPLTARVVSIVFILLDTTADPPY